MAIINDFKVMTFNKPYTLLFFLLCFCFISTSFAQPCLSETNLSSGYHCQLELEDNHEPFELLSSHNNVNKHDGTCEVISYTPLKNLNLQSLPCCNRGPPTYFILSKTAINTIS